MVAQECWVSSGGNENILRWTVVMVAQVGEDSVLNPTVLRTLNRRNVWWVRDRSIQLLKSWGFLGLAESMVVGSPPRTQQSVPPSVNVWCGTPLGLQSRGMPFGGVTWPVAAPVKLFIFKGPVVRVGLQSHVC